MNILIYGNASDKELLVQHMKSQACMAFRKTDYWYTDEYDTFLNMLNINKYEIVFVLMDNAVGMEGVIAVKNTHPDTPIIWFSNDKNFVAQSYRLGVTYFSVKPIEEKIVKLALSRCQRREEFLYE